jgi:hypothetical protein
MSERYTRRDVETMAYNILRVLVDSGRVPAGARVAVFPGSVREGTSWEVAVVLRIGDSPLGLDRIPTSLDRLLDGVGTAREAYRILAAVYRAESYRWHERAARAAGGVEVPVPTDRAVHALLSQVYSGDVGSLRRDVGLVLDALAANV